MSTTTSSRMAAPQGIEVTGLILNFKAIVPPVDIALETVEYEISVIDVSEPDKLQTVVDRLRTKETIVDLEAHKVVGAEFFEENLFKVEVTAHAGKRVGLTASLEFVVKLVEGKLTAIISPVNEPSAEPTGPDQAAPKTEVEVKEVQTVTPLPPTPVLAPRPVCGIVGNTMTITPQAGENAYIMYAYADGKTVGISHPIPMMNINAQTKVNVFNLAWSQLEAGHLVEEMLYDLGVFALNEKGDLSVVSLFKELALAVKKEVEKAPAEKSQPLPLPLPSPTEPPRSEPAPEPTPAASAPRQPEERPLAAIPSRLVKIQHDLAWLSRDPARRKVMLGDMATALTNMLGQLIAATTPANEGHLAPLVERVQGLRSGIEKVPEQMPQVVADARRRMGDVNLGLKLKNELDPHTLREMQNGLRHFLSELQKLPQDAEVVAVTQDLNEYVQRIEKLRVTHSRERKALERRIAQITEKLGSIEPDAGHPVSQFEEQLAKLVTDVTSADTMAQIEALLPVSKKLLGEVEAATQPTPTQQPQPAPRPPKTEGPKADADKDDAVKNAAEKLAREQAEADVARKKAEVQAETEAKAEVEAEAARQKAAAKAEAQRKADEDLAKAARADEDAARVLRAKQRELQQAEQEVIDEQIKTARAKAENEARARAAATKAAEAEEARHEEERRAAAAAEAKTKKGKTAAADEPIEVEATLVDDKKKKGRTKKEKRVLIVVGLVALIAIIAAVAWNWKPLKEKFGWGAPVVVAEDKDEKADDSGVIAPSESPTNDAASQKPTITAPQPVPALPATQQSSALAAWTNVPHMPMLQSIVISSNHSSGIGSGNINVGGYQPIHVYVFPTNTVIGTPAQPPLHIKSAPVAPKRKMGGVSIPENLPCKPDADGNYHWKVEMTAGDAPVHYNFSSPWKLRFKDFANLSDRRLEYIDQNGNPQEFLPGKGSISFNEFRATIMSDARENVELEFWLTK